MTRETTIKTTNQTFGEIEVTIQCEVPENLQEASEFFEGEDKLLDVVQQEVVRRRANTARPVLRDAKTQLDWPVVAQQAADAYTPGRKGGFQRPEVSATALESVNSQDELLALLANAGVNIT